MKLANTIIPVLALLAATTGVQARGLLGQNYVEASVGFASVDVGAFSDVENWTYGLGGNYALLQTGDNSSIGLDIGGDVALLDGEGFEATGLSVDTVVYYDAGQFKPGIGLSLAYVFEGDNADDEFGGSVAALVEWEISKDTTLTPFIAYNRVEEGTDSWAYGSELAFWVNEHLNVGVTGSYDRYDNDIDGYSMMLNVRYGF
ncbi:MAG: hypothetical protein SFY80_17440 [Verrucomicrobiota bacterium]|nr:hypothetical protein [Verrucomicrobiota bacterium]